MQKNLRFLTLSIMQRRIHGKHGKIFFKKKKKGKVAFMPKSCEEHECLSIKTICVRFSSVNCH